MNKKTLTFGETMLRISPQTKEQRIFQTDNFKIEPGGSESNVAVNLSNLGNKTSFLTKLPDNQLGKIVLRYLNRYNVDTSNIVLGSNRLGIYWTEHGIGPRASNVIYDRENSAVNSLDNEEINYKKVFEGVKWFHTSGITPALSKNCMVVLDNLLEEAKKLSINISMDLNYRSKLWQWIENTNFTIEEVMGNIADKCDLLVGNESDFQNIFGIKSNKDDQLDRYKEIAEKVFNNFSNLKYIAVSLRDSISASENIWSGLFFINNNNSIELIKGNSYHLKNVVDRVGGGDSFASGIIHGLINNMNYEETLEFAIGFSALKHTVRGDISEFSVEDVEHLIETEASGRIIR